MEKTRSILETIGNATYVGIHYIIFYGRKYPLIPAAYLLLFIWFFFLRKPALPPAPVSSTPGGSYAPGGSYYFPGLNSPQTQRAANPRTHRSSHPNGSSISFSERRSHYLTLESSRRRASNLFGW